MDDRDILRNWQATAAQLGLVALAMEDFATQIIRHVLRRGVLDERAFSKIKDTAILNLKNAEAMGLPVEREAEAFRVALQHLEKLMDAAILKGRKLDES